MLKKLLFVAALIFPMLAGAQTLKLGVVDTQSIFGTMPETAAAQTKLTEVQKKYQDEFTRLEAEYTRLIEEFQKMGQDELPAIRERKTREITDYQTKMQQFEQTAGQDIQQQQQQLMQPIMQKIKDAIDAVGREGSYSMIQEKDALLFVAAPVDDLTPQVKAKLGLK
ncbi:MAG: OmpH family outer membrane protein [Bacteroidales bacterium]|nr:OmpH family outer membrane protein [Bacteroidales bacterium]